MTSAGGRLQLSSGSATRWRVLRHVHLLWRSCRSRLSPRLLDHRDPGPAGRRPGRRGGHRRVHHARPAAPAAAQLRRGPRVGPGRARPGPAAAQDRRAAAPPRPRPAASPAGTRRAVPGRGRRRVRRLPAAAHPVAVLQHHVPAVPRSLGGRRAEHAAHAQPARRAAGQSLAGRRGPAQRAGRGVRGAVRAAGGGRGAGRPGRPPGGAGRPPGPREAPPRPRRGARRRGARRRPPPQAAVRSAW